jgi:hypothetical protein
MHVPRGDEPESNVPAGGVVSITPEVIEGGGALVPAIPDPGMDVIVPHICARVMEWLPAATDVAAMNDVRARLEAIDVYLQRTSEEGRAEVAATMRRLEVRIGELLGPATVGAHSSATEGARLTKDARFQCRQMAAHPEVVEEIIATSTDRRPATRRAVMAKINKDEKPRPRRRFPDQLGDACADLYTALKRLQRLIDDDRFQANREGLPPTLRPQLAAVGAVAEHLWSRLTDGGES